MTIKKSATFAIAVALAVIVFIPAIAADARDPGDRRSLFDRDLTGDGLHVPVDRGSVPAPIIQKSADVTLGGNEFSSASSGGGWPQPNSSHWHSNDPLSSPAASRDSVEVGELGSEECRGMVEFDVNGTPPAVIAASVACVVEIEGGLYGQSKTTFDVLVSSYDGNNAEELGDYSIATTGVVDLFSTGPLFVGDQVSIDVTDAYNTAVTLSVPALGLRFQANSEPNSGAMTFFECQLYLTTFDQVLDALEAKLDALEIKLDELKPEVVDLKAETTDIKAEVTDIKAELTDVKAELTDVKAELVDLKAEVVAIAADLAMAREERITFACMNRKMVAKYFLPAGKGGLITDVRDLATQRVADIGGVGEGTNGASSYLTQGNNYLGQGKFKLAYQKYCIALCRASVLPTSAGYCGNWRN